MSRRARLADNVSLNASSRNYLRRLGSYAEASVGPMPVARVPLRQFCIAVSSRHLTVTGEVTDQLKISRGIAGRD